MGHFLADSKRQLSTRLSYQFEQPKPSSKEMSNFHKKKTVEKPNLRFRTTHFYVSNF